MRATVRKTSVGLTPAIESLIAARANGTREVGRNSGFSEALRTMAVLYDRAAAEGHASLRRRRRADYFRRRAVREALGVCWLRVSLMGVDAWDALVAAVDRAAPRTLLAERVKELHFIELLALYDDFLKENSDHA